MQYSNLWEYALENGWQTTDDPKKLTWTSKFGVPCYMTDNLSASGKYLLEYIIDNVPTNLNVDASLPLEEQVAFFNAFFGAIGL